MAKNLSVVNKLIVCDPLQYDGIKVTPFHAIYLQANLD